MKLEINVCMLQSVDLSQHLHNLQATPTGDSDLRNRIIPPPPLVFNITRKLTPYSICVCWVKYSLGLMYLHSLHLNY